MNKYISLFIILFLIGCVSKENHEKTLEENNHLKSKNDSLQYKLNEYNKLNELLEKKISDYEYQKRKSESIRKYSNAEIIQIVKGDIEYYCPRVSEVKDFSVRIYNENEYNVKFKTKEPDVNLGTFNGKPQKIVQPWETQVYRITFLKGEKYRLKHIVGNIPCRL